jgi:Transcription factor Iwr1
LWQNFNEKSHSSVRIFSKIAIFRSSVVEYGEYIYTTHRGDEGNLESDDSEDSNEENNWRNDYPEEEDNSSIDENDMRAAMGRCDLGKKRWC